MLQLKLYFTTKPNGRMRHLFPPSSLLHNGNYKNLIEKKIVSLVFIQCKELEIYDKKS